MSLLRAARVRLRALTRRAEVDQELDEELRYHLERETERLVAGGMAPGEAAAAARRTFGNVGYTKESARDAYGLRLIDQVSRDLAFSARLARKHPAFGAVIVLSLALGLGGTVAMFSLTYSVLFAPLPLPAPDQLVALARVDRTDGSLTFSMNELRALRGASGAAALTAIRGASQIAVELGTAREFVNMTFVDGAFFPVLGVRLLRGRAIGRDDELRGATVAVVSELFAKRLFGSDSAALGQTLGIRGIRFTIIGVTPRAFRGVDYPGQFTVAIPTSTVVLIARAGNRPDDQGIPLGDTNDDQRMFKVVARISEHRQATLAALAAVFDHCCAAVAPGVRQRLEVIDIERGVPNGKNDFRGEVAPVLVMLLAGMALLLAVVCCNLASLLVVRTAARQRELAVRLSLGASRARLVSQLVLETLPLSILGGLLGVFVAGWATAAMLRAIPEADAYVDLVRFRFEPAVLFFAAGATLVGALAYSAYPALRATRAPIGQALRLDAHASRSRREGVLARGAVATQVALTVVLVSTAGLLAVTLRQLARVDGGYATDHLLLINVEARGTNYERGGVSPIRDRILEEIRRLPGVTFAAAGSMLPLFGGTTGWVELDLPGSRSSSGHRPAVQLNAVSPLYFETLGSRLRSGRGFTGADRRSAEAVAVVNSAFARHFFGNVDPVGRTLRAMVRGDTMVPLRIVGVAADMKYADLRSSPEQILYLPLAQTTDVWNALQFAVRVEGDAAAATHAVAEAIDAAAPGIRLRRMSDMQARVSMAMAVQRLATELAALASALVLVLSVIGLYGVVAYTVARRTSELGVRLALGATRGSIVWLVLRETLRISSIGVAIGMVLSFGASEALRSQLFGVGAHDPFVLAVSVTTLALVSLLAGGIPALRASRLDPRIALAAE